MRTAEMENVFGEEELFAENSRSILNTRSDVGYVRLLDRNGVLEKSFGVQDDSGFEKLTVKGPEGKAVLVGIKTPSGDGNYLNMALWSLLAGSLMAVALSFFLRAMNARSLRFLGNFSDAMRRLSRGDYSARIEPGSSFAANPGLARLCREFNDMVSSISPVPPGEKESEEDSVADAGESAVPADAKDAEETARGRFRRSGSRAAFLFSPEDSSQGTGTDARGRSPARFGGRGDSLRADRRRRTVPLAFRTTAVPPGTERGLRCSS